MVYVPSFKTSLHPHERGPHVPWTGNSMPGALFRFVYRQTLASTRFRQQCRCRNIFIRVDDTTSSHAFIVR